MIMPIGGSVQNYMKTVKLNMKWKEREDNIQALAKKQEDPKIKQLREEMDQMQKGNAIASIDGKLKAGKKISSEELDFLKEHSPDLYKKAIEVQKEREAYERELRSCKTKDDVAKLNLRRMNNFMNEAKAVSNNPSIGAGKKLEYTEQITRRVMAVQDSHSTFIASEEYEKLPESIEELEEEEKDKNERKAKKEEEKRKLIELLGETPESKKAKEYLEQLQKDIANDIEKKSASKGEDNTVSDTSVEENVSDKPNVDTIADVDNSPAPTTPVSTTSAPPAMSTTPAPATTTPVTLTTTYQAGTTSYVPVSNNTVSSTVSIKV